MLPSDRDHARRLGARLGTLAWQTTEVLLRAIVVALRVALVVTVSAWLWHAIVPGMAFGAWAVLFLAGYVVTWPIAALTRGIRRAAGVGRMWWARRARFH